MTDTLTEPAACAGLLHIARRWPEMAHVNAIEFISGDLWTLEFANVLSLDKPAEADGLAR